MFRLMVADFDSPSYFVAIAAVELGFFKREGIDVELECTYGAHNGANRLRDGTLHFFGGPAYSAATVFPAWKGAKLLCALSQYSYWSLAIRADLDVKRGDLGALRGLRISTSMAAPVLGLRHLLVESGIALNETTSGLCRLRLQEMDVGWGMPASMPLSRALPTLIGVMPCGSRLARSSASPNSTLTFVVATVRPELAGTTLQP